MPLRAAISLLALLAAAAQGRVVDRIVACIEMDVITLSEVRELGAFQQLAGAPRTDDAALLRQLIEQWIVANDAAAARFRQPSEASIDKDIAELEASFPSRQAYLARLGELALSEKAVRRLMLRRVYLSHYLEYKFRPAVQVDPADIEGYYGEDFTRDLRARKQPVPALEEVSEQIRELLVEREISRRAAEWLEQTRAQIRVEFPEQETGK
jgi:hypothetical protein